MCSEVANEFPRRIFAKLRRQRHASCIPDLVSRVVILLVKLKLWQRSGQASSAADSRETERHMCDSRENGDRSKAQNGYGDCLFLKGESFAQQKELACSNTS